MVFVRKEIQYTMDVIWTQYIIIHNKKHKHSLSIRNETIRDGEIINIKTETDFDINQNWRFFSYTYIISFPKSSIYFFKKDVIHHINTGNMDSNKKRR